VKHLIPIPDTPPKQSTVIDWLADGIAASLDQPALHYKGVVLSYRELDDQSHQVANYLIASGITPGDRVGLCLDRSIEMIVAVVGVLKSGAAYVPLDSAYPADRLAMMIEDVGLHCLFTHAAYATLFAEAIVWEDLIGTLKEESIEASNGAIDPENPAYIIFTSGSTGRPKGVEMPHRALANLIEWQLERKSFKPAARVLQYSSISFDVSFQELATTFASGGTLFLISSDDQKDPRRLLDQLVEQKIERLFLPYVAMRSLMETAHAVNTYPEFLKELITAGEQLRVDEALRRFIKQIVGASLDNQYGPSETHVITAHLLAGDPSEWPELPSIGTPLKNCGTLILNEAMLPLEDGQEGELFLAGRNLASGYIGRNDLTAEVFMPNPFEIPERTRLYKTGDLAAYHPDGSIELRGRRDHQIKIRGHRIEPGEINNAAASFPGLGQCLAHASKGADEMLQLAAYYTVKAGCTVEHTALRVHLEGQLPRYMVPAFLIELPGIPYTPSGKVDLKALPKPSIQNSPYANDELHYESETEQALAQIWSDLLGMDGIPRSANFFEIGGDSLRAVRLFHAISQQLGHELPLATLARAPTVRGLAAIIDGGASDVSLDDFRSLQCIQQGDPEVPPIFMIHGGAGNVVIFREFAQNLGSDQPVYAFQWSGWDGHRGPRTIPEMAAAYKEELLRFRPAKSYRIGGHCIGGLIAIELAHQLGQEGLEVDGPIIVSDSPNLKSVQYRPREPENSPASRAAFKQMVEALERQKIAAGMAWNLPTLVKPSFGLSATLKKFPAVIRAIRRARAFPEQIKISLMLARGQKIPMDRRAFYSATTLCAAAKRHISPKHPGDIVYFRSACVLGRNLGLEGWWDDSFFGFGELCGGRFEGHVVGGGHNEVLNLPEVAELVRRAWAAGS